MKNRYKASRLCILGFILIMAMLFAEVPTVNASQTTSSRVKAVFSWQTEAVDDGGTELFDLLDNLGANVVYQDISEDTDSETIKIFLQNAYKRGITVYLLEGHPDWCLENDATPYIEVVKRVEKYNQLVNADEAIKGIVYDVEPHTLDEWDEDKKVLMNNYAKAMKNTHKAAKKKGISIVICIPYYYENHGMTSQLKKLIKDGCDEVAIMNYYRSNEIEHIKTEAKYALKYGKRLINIFEFKPAGTHGLTDKNTYYELGLDAAEESFAKIEDHYNNQEVYYGLHDAEILKELIER